MSNEIIYKDQPVITTKTIADEHGLEVKVLNQKFRRNKKYFAIEIDYFEVSVEEARRSQIVTASKYDSSDYLLLITKRGYLKFVKTINDDKAWNIYNNLIESYFQSKRLDGLEQKFLQTSKQNRTGLTQEWSSKGAKNYGGLTLAEYESIGFDKQKRKSAMDDSELSLLSAFEFLEAKKLNNNPDIYGDKELIDSLSETGQKVIDIIKNRKQVKKITSERNDIKAKGEMCDPVMTDQSTW